VRKMAGIYHSKDSEKRDEEDVDVRRQSLDIEELDEEVAEA
jgi:hypothetical protein